MTDNLTEDQMRQVVRRACDAAGSLTKWAKEHGLSPGFVHDVTSGRRAITDTITQPLGYEFVGFYRKRT